MPRLGVHSFAPMQQWLGGGGHPGRAMELWTRLGDYSLAPF